MFDVVAFWNMHEMLKWSYVLLKVKAFKAHADAKDIKESYYQRLINYKKKLNLQFINEIRIHKHW
jgi:hypothetical protein